MSSCRTHIAAFLGVLAASAIASCDPVHSDARDALGGEAPNVPTGPTHRPGQPCLICHDGALGDPPAFSVAGTIYLYSTEAISTSPGIVVTLRDANGTAFLATTNEVGNFYATPDAFTPVYPVAVSIAADTSTTAVAMKSHIGRDGSCAGCHVDPSSASSPGHVFLNVVGDGGVP